MALSRDMLLKITETKHGQALNTMVHLLRALRIGKVTF